MNKIYIAGPYTAPDRDGEDRNIRAAAQVAAEYMKLGWAVFCPHTMTSIIDREFNADKTLDWEDWLTMDLCWLMECDAIYMLPGWRKSQGAQLEYMVAKAQGITVLGEME